MEQQRRFVLEKLETALRNGTYFFSAAQIAERLQTTDALKSYSELQEQVPKRNNALPVRSQEGLKGMH